MHTTSYNLLRTWHACTCLPWIAKRTKACKYSNYTWLYTYRRQTQQHQKLRGMSTYHIWFMIHLNATIWFSVGSSHWMSLKAGQSLYEKKPKHSFCAWLCEALSTKLPSTHLWDYARMIAADPLLKPFLIKSLQYSIVIKLMDFKCFMQISY